MYYGNSSNSSMKFYKRLGIYKASNCSFDADSMIAKSYDWFVFVRRVNGLIVFNDYNYSQSTCGHQSKVKALLKDLGIKVDVYVSISDSLTNDCLDTALAKAYGDKVALELALNRKNARPNSRSYKFKQADLKDAEQTIVKLTGVGAKCSKAKQSEIKASAIKNESDRLERQRQSRVNKNTGKPLVSSDAFVRKSESYELVV